MYVIKYIHRVCCVRISFSDSTGNFRLIKSTLNTLSTKLSTNGYCVITTFNECIYGPHQFTKIIFNALFRLKWTSENFHLSKCINFNDCIRHLLFRWYFYVTYIIYTHYNIKRKRNRILDICTKQEQRWILFYIFI